MLGIKIFARSIPVVRLVVLSDDEFVKVALESARTKGDKDREPVLTLELIS